MLPSLSTPVLSVLIIIVSLGYIVFGVDTLRRYDQIGVQGLSLFSIAWGLNFIVSSIVVSILYSAGFRSGSELVDISFSQTSELVLIASTPLRGLLMMGGIFLWFWFVYQYTTLARQRDELIIVGLGTLVVVIATLNGLVGALSSFAYIQLPPELLRGGFFEFASLLEILGTGIAIGLGVAQLSRTARWHTPFARQAAVALSLAVVFPYLLRYLYQFSIIPQFQLIQLLRFLSLGVGLGGLVLATNKYRLFDQLPAAQTIGRDASFEMVNTAIVVLDDQFRVTDINIATEELFNIAKADIIGQPLSTLLPSTVKQTQITEPGEHMFELVDTGTIIEAKTTVTTDYRDRDFGRVIVFKNITKERRRQQRIQVLNRVLRHNLRNNLVVANGRLDMLANETSSKDQHIAKIRESLDDVVEMGSKAGTIEAVLQADQETTEPRPLSDSIGMAVAELDAEYDTSRIHVEVATDTHTSANPVIVEAILFELLENAIEHTTGGKIVVEIPVDGSQIIVRDDGLGIPEDEREVFIRGEETPLQHGSGLGLWLVKWGVRRIGGNLTFEIDNNGTEITIYLPEELRVDAVQAKT